MYFRDGIFFILIEIAWKFVPEGPIDNKSALVQVLAGCRPAAES